MNQVKFQTTAAHRHQLAISGAASLISIDHGPPPGTRQGLWVTGTAHECVRLRCECDHMCVGTGVPGGGEHLSVYARLRVCGGNGWQRGWCVWCGCGWVSVCQCLLWGWGAKYRGSLSTLLPAPIAGTVPLCLPTPVPLMVGFFQEPLAPLPSPVLPQRLCPAPSLQLAPHGGNPRIPLTITSLFSLASWVLAVSGPWLSPRYARPPAQS